MSRFRNYRELNLPLPPGFLVFHGANGAGKTNLLEAVHLLCQGRSPRTRHDAGLVLFGEREAFLRAAVAAGDAGAELALRVAAAEGRCHTLNGRRVSGGDLARRFPVVYTAPEEIGIVSGGPALRRAWLDDLAARCVPGYARHWEAFRTCLEQRNELLRQRVGEEGACLEAWDEQMARHGAVLARRRRQLVERLNLLAAAEYNHLAGRETASLSYEPAWAAGGGESEEAAYLASLAAARPVDARCGFTTVGPHRDDVSLAINGREARLYASRGQRRTMLLALKLAAARLLEEAFGRRPLLLLDDVLAELDGRRRDRLLERLQEWPQVFLAAAEPLPGEELPPGRGTYFSVEEGEIRPARGTGDVFAGVALDGAG